MIEGSVNGPPVNLRVDRVTSARTSPLLVPRGADVGRGGPEDLPLFSWVVLGDQIRHVEGVSDDAARAVAAVSDALSATVGSSGEVRTCRVCSFGRIAYVYGPVVARATLDRVTGSVVWGDA
jgi:hypothetical protein